jgi:phosphatidylinositol glycan class M
MKASTLILALLIRLIVIIIGEYQKSITGLEYADLDYKVYTDGAKYALEGLSPMERHTYRYTPLLAYLMIPNIYFFNFGKLFFCLNDLLCSVVSDKILKL